MALTSINLQTEDAIERCAYLLRDSSTNNKYSRGSLHPAKGIDLLLTIIII